MTAKGLKASTIKNYLTLIKPFFDEVNKNYRDVTSDDIKKTVLVLEQVSEDAISAVFYRSYNDGKIRKEEIQSTRYRLSLCPEDVVKKILDKNCIIKTY